MGNHITISDEDDNVLGSLNLPLSCFAYLSSEIITKYNPSFRPHMTETINEDLEPVYENCEPHEEVQMLLFINDESEFDESDITKFDEAIQKYPEDLNQTPKKALIAFRDFLKEHKCLKTNYSHSTMGMSIKELK